VPEAIAATRPHAEQAAVRRWQAGHQGWPVAREIPHGVVWPQMEHVSSGSVRQREHSGPSGVRRRTRRRRPQPVQVSRFAGSVMKQWAHSGRPWSSRVTGSRQAPQRAHCWVRESSEAQPTLPIAKAIAQALDISLDELAGEDAHRISLTGQWWASWQTSRSGTEKIATQEVEIKQEGSSLRIQTLTRGLSAEEGGYHWSGELRLWDNEILMGWYASTDGSIRSKGTMYFVLHPHGLNMSGRWVGLGYDDQIMTGFASMAHSHEESEETIARLIHSKGEVARAGK